MTATDWENRYRTEDTPWEKGEPHPGLVDWLREGMMQGQVLVPGCGSGHDARAIASTGAEVIGLDVAPSAIERAKALPRTGRESYVVGDLFSLPDRFEGQFDWVWEHTCFCAIDPARRPDYAQSVHAALKAGGHLLAVFYLDPGLDPGETGPPFGVTLEELDALFAPRFTLLRESTPTQTYGGREGRERMRLYVK